MTDMSSRTLKAGSSGGGITVAASCWARRRRASRTGSQNRVPRTTWRTGTHVTGLAGANDAEFVARCGAGDVLDYRAVSAADIGPFDVIIDTTGRGILAFRRRLARGGRMVTINPVIGGARAHLWR